MYASLIDSETLTITTYYPAPYGGYVRLLTTDTTILARDGGAVGIGTSSPNAELNVKGTSNFSRDNAGECCSGGNYTLSLAENTFRTGRTAKLQFHNGGIAEGYIQLANGGTRRLQLGDHQGANMGLQMSGPLYVDNTGNSYIMGNLGVGTNSPWNRLHVNGDLRVTGTIYGVCRLVYYGSGGGTGCNGDEVVMGHFGDGNRRKVLFALSSNCTMDAIHNPNCWEPIADGYDWVGHMYCCRISP